MSNMKKMLVGVIAAAIAATCAVTASAAWKEAAYDTDHIINEAGTYKCSVTYMEFDDNGLPTGLVVTGKAAKAYGLNPYATVTFSAPNFEKAYPNRQYVSIYANGKDTRKVMYNGVTEPLQYRDVNYMWELAAPHKVYQRKQALINGAWYSDGSYPMQFLGDVATVKAEYNNYYGFGLWNVVDANNDGYAEAIKDYMTAELYEYAPNLNENIYTYYEDEYGNKVKTTEGVHVDALAPGEITDLTVYKPEYCCVTGETKVVVDVENQYDFIDVRKAFNLVVSGPEYDINGVVQPGKEFARVYNAADDKLAFMPYDLAHFNVPELVKYVTGTEVALTPYMNGNQPEVGKTTYVDYALAKTTWVDAGYEFAPPYNRYQILKVDGVLLDGSWLTVADDANDVHADLLYLFRTEEFSDDEDSFDLPDTHQFRTVRNGDKVLYQIKLPYVFRYTGATANPVELVHYETPLVASFTLNADGWKYWAN